MADPILITDATVEPLTVAELKEHKRIDFADEDNLLEAYIVAARKLFEDLTGRTLHETTWEYALDRFPYGNCAIELPRAAPLLSITSVIYLNENGASTVWGSSNYIADTHRMPGMIAPAYGVSWPSFTPYPLSAVRIRYKAGIIIGSPQTYPGENIRQCIREMAAALYDNREQVVVTDRASVAAFAINPLTAMLIENCKVKRAF